MCLQFQKAECFLAWRLLVMEGLMFTRSGCMVVREPLSSRQPSISHFLTFPMSFVQPAQTNRNPLYWDPSQFQLDSRAHSVLTVTNRMQRYSLCCPIQFKENGGRSGFLIANRLRSRFCSLSSIHRRSELMPGQTFTSFAKDHFWSHTDLRHTPQKKNEKRYRFQLVELHVELNDVAACR